MEIKSTVPEATDASVCVPDDMELDAPFEMSSMVPLAIPYNRVEPPCKARDAVVASEAAVCLGNLGMTLAIPKGLAIKGMQAGVEAKGSTVLGHRSGFLAGPDSILIAPLKRNLTAGRTSE